MELVNLDRRIHGHGTAAAQWETWLNPPPLVATPSHSRLVVVAPHPDDEVLAAGGLLGRHTQQSRNSLVIAVTNGEASHAQVPEWNPTLLSQLRQLESTAGLSVLGVTAQQVVRLGVPDGQVAAHTTEIRKRLASLLRPTDRVVTTWRFDGHPDHEATGQCVAEVCHELACELLEAPVWMWHWAQPGLAAIPWQRLRSLRLDAATVQRKQAALACHISQIKARSHSLAPVLEHNILDRTGWAHEYFFIGEASA